DHASTRGLRGRRRAGVSSRLAAAYGVWRRRRVVLARHLALDHRLDSDVTALVEPALGRPPVVRRHTVRVLGTFGSVLGHRKQRARRGGRQPWGLQRISTPSTSPPTRPAPGGST